MDGVVTTQNRGVNITADDFEPQEEETVAPTNRLQIDLQNVIDLIETGTPHFLCTSSSLDADNEESIVSSVSVISSALTKMKRSSENDLLELVSHESESYRARQESSCDNRPHGIVTELPTSMLCRNHNCPCAHHCNCLQVQSENKTRGRRFSLPAVFEKLLRRDRAVTNDLYKINITQSKNDTCPPKRFVFDLIDEVPKHVISTGTNTRQYVKEHVQKTSVKCNPTRKGCNVRHSNYSGVVMTHLNQKKNVVLRHPNWYKKKVNSKKPETDPARMDVYYFDHGNSAYYQTTDLPPINRSEFFAEKTESYAKKFWAEVFGTLYIGCAFITAFIHQFFRFIIHGILQPLTTGLLQLVSDYFLKPFLVTAFNSIIQPPLIFIYNVITSLRDICDPISDAVGYFMREIAVLCRSIRLFEVKRDNPTHKCNENKCNDA